MNLYDCIAVSLFILTAGFCFCWGEYLQFLRLTASTSPLSYPLSETTPASE